MNGSEAIVRTLQGLGVDVIFGLCGDTTLPLYEALYDIDHGMRHVLTRDERSASFMADAYARFSGRVGVCEGPSGGGATYILPGVAEANGSSAPLVCLTSDIDQADMGRGTLTELDQNSLFRPVTKATFSPSSAAEVSRILRDAFRAATSGALGATHVRLPFDVQTGDAGSELHLRDSGDRYPTFRMDPEPALVEKAAHMLSEAKRPLIVAGAGVLRSGAWDEVTELAHRLGTPVATSIGGKGSIAETDPYALGVIGSNGGLAYRHAFVRSADVIFYVGCGMGSVTTEKWTLPRNGEQRILQLDVDPEKLGLNYDTELGLVADAKRGGAALLETLAPSTKVDPAELECERTLFLASVEDTFTSDATPIRPERFLTELLPRLPETSVICADPGTGCPYMSAYYRLPRAGRWFVSPRAHGALGYALPGVVGAYFARSDAGRVVGLMGDGSFGISCGELETIVRLNLPITLVVFNNRSFGWIKAGQRVRGEKYYSVDFRDSNHAAIAEAFGMRARRVEKPAELGPAIEESLACDDPHLLDVVTQPLHEAKAPVSNWIA